jgi:hypothetical protein
VGALLLMDYPPRGITVPQLIGILIQHKVQILPGFSVLIRPACVPQVGLVLSLLGALLLMDYPPRGITVPQLIGGGLALSMGYTIVSVASLPLYLNLSPR